MEEFIKIDFVVFSFLLSLVFILASEIGKVKKRLGIAFKLIEHLVQQSRIEIQDELNEKEAK